MIKFIDTYAFKAMQTLNSTSKVRIFWEGHKIWKNLPLKIYRYWVVSNFEWKIFFQISWPSQNVQTWKLRLALHWVGCFKEVFKAVLLWNMYCSKPYCVCGKTRFFFKITRESKNWVNFFKLDFPCHTGVEVSQK